MVSPHGLRISPAPASMQLPTSRFRRCQEKIWSQKSKRFIQASCVRANLVPCAQFVGKKANRLGGVAERCWNVRENALGMGMSDKAAAWWRESSKFDEEILDMAVPVLLNSLLFPLTSVIDAAVVGRLGIECLGAVGISGLLWTVILLMFSFIRVKGTTEGARAAGTGNLEKLSKESGTVVQLCMILGCALSLATFLSSEWLMTSVIKPDPAILPHAISYFKSLSLLAPVYTLNAYFGGVTNGLQRSRTVLAGAILTCALNAVLNVVFVFGLGWGVIGAGLATVVSTATATAYLIAELFRNKYLQLKNLLVPVDTKEMLKIVLNGQGLIFRSISKYGLFVLASTCATQMGTLESATFEVTRQMYLLTINSYIALQVTSQALCAKYHSGGDRTSLMLVVNRLLQMATISAAACSCLGYLFLPQLIHIYTSNPLVVDQVKSLALILFGPLVAEALASVLDGVQLGIGDVNFASIAMLLTTVTGIIGIVCLNNLGMASIFALYCCIKFGNVGCLLFTVPRLFLSKDSPMNVQTAGRLLAES